jgi:hypothetical protein
MIVATAIVAELPLYTTNPDDFTGLDHLVTVISVTRPEVPNERYLGQLARNTNDLAANLPSTGYELGTVRYRIGLNTYRPVPRGPLVTRGQRRSTTRALPHATEMAQPAVED